MMSTRSSLKRKTNASEGPAGDSTAAVSTASSTQTGMSANMSGVYSTGYALANPQTTQGADNSSGLTSSSMPDAMASDENSGYIFDFSSGPPAVPTQKVRNVGNLTSMHGRRSEDVKAGYEFYYEARRPLNVANDDFAELENNISYYVTILYEHITTTPESMTKEQTTMVQRFEKKLTAMGQVADQHLANISSMVVQAIIMLHKKGDHLYPSQFKALKPHKYDSNSTATQRFHQICKRVADHKKHAIDLMEGGADAITKFVAAPWGATRRKNAYKANNDQRAEKFKEAMKRGTGSSEEVENEQKENENEQEDNDDEGEENEDEEDD